jgi:hypothetical protein
VHDAIRSRPDGHQILQVTAGTVLPFTHTRQQPVDAVAAAVPDEHLLGPVSFVAWRKVSTGDARLFAASLSIVACSNHGLTTGLFRDSMVPLSFSMA